MASISYPREFPVGAFVVDSKRALQPLVQAMRTSGRLASNGRGARSVTSMDMTWMRCELAGSKAPLDGAGKESTIVMEARLHEDTGAYEDPITVYALAAKTASVEGWFSPMTSGASTEWWAVHVTGHWSSSDIQKYLGPASTDGIQPVAFVRGLRRFHRVCCPLHQLPPELQALREHIHVQSETSSAGTFSVSELFGGIGMFRLGLERVGGRTSFAVECATAACSTYRTNFFQPPSSTAAAAPATAPTSTLIGDITSVPSAFFPSHDLLTAGFPCQSFAKAGPSLGLTEAKGWLFFEVVRVLQVSRPKVFLLENVEHLVQLDEGAQLEVILAALRAGTLHQTDGASPRYHVDYRVIDGGLVTPQRRRRVYFVGIRLDVAELADPNAPSGLPSRILDSAAERLASMGRHFPTVEDLLEPDDAVEGHQLTNSQWQTLLRCKQFRQHPSWRIVDVKGTSRTLMGSYRTSYQLYSEFVPFPRSLTIAQVESWVAEHGCREDGDAVDEVLRPPLRFLSVREAARLQGIPDDFVLPVAIDSDASDSSGAGGGLPIGALYKLVGNAVNPLVTEALGHAIKSHMSW